MHLQHVESGAGYPRGQVQDLAGDLDEGVPGALHANRDQSIS